MKIAGRTPLDYSLATWKHMGLVLILSAVTVFGRLNGAFPHIMLYLPFVGIVLVVWAGWHVVRNRGFTLTQTAAVGFALSFASHWTLPIFHGVREILWLFLVNSMVFVATALLGGFLAKKVRVLQSRKPREAPCVQLNRPAQSFAKTSTDIGNTFMPESNSDVLHPHGHVNRFSPDISLPRRKLTRPGLRRVKRIH